VDEFGREKCSIGVGHGGTACGERIERRLPADAAARCRGEVAFEAIERERNFGLKLDANGVRVVVRHDPLNILATTDHTFGEEEPGRKFLVVARRSHRE
jgi:hypothetical protein